MQELRTLESWLLDLREELKELKARKKSLEKLMNLQGYSLKTIKGNTYLYVWRTVGHARAVWKSLGNIKRIGGMAVIEELRRDKVDVLLKEWERLTQREEEIKELVKQVIEVLEEQESKNSMEVAV